MPIISLEALAQALRPNRRLLGLDLGTKTIGVALSDPGRVIASPLDTVKRTKFTADATQLATLVADFDIGGLVIGLPLNMDGSEGPRAQSTRQFATNLLAGLDIAVAFWDERLSTAAVERLLVRDADMSRKRRAEVVDKMAASYILQGALDYVNAMPDGRERANE